MLDILRANARSALTYVLFGIIIVVFVVSFGPGSCGTGGASRGRTPQGNEPAAKVNGDVITAGDFDQHYAELFRAYQAQTGGQLTRELADQLGLRRVALDQLVERALLRQEAAKRGIVVTDAELERAIKEHPAFQSGGRFDYDYYQRAVSNAYGSAARFEDRLREDLAVQRMGALLRQTAKVSDAEVKEAWLAEADQVNVEFVRFPLSLAREEAKVTPAEAEAFAKASPDRVKAAYEETKARWDQPKRAKARHVLVKVDEKAPEADAEAAKKKAEAVAERAKKGEDFAKLAQEASEDAGTKANGGDLGWFGPGVMAKPFEDAAFGAKKGEVVGPVRTRFGFHVIRVDDVQEARQIPLDDVKNEVAREVLEQERAKQAARKKADAALAAARGGKPLAELFPADEQKAQKLGGKPVAAQETGLFSPGGPVPRVGDAPALATAAFAADGPKVLDQVFDTADGPLVARVKERRKPDAAQFEQKKAEHADRLRAQRGAELERDFVKALRDRASLTVNDAIAGGPGLASVGQ